MFFLQTCTNHWLLFWYFASNSWLIYFTWTNDDSIHWLLYESPSHNMSINQQLSLITVWLGNMFISLNWVIIGLGNGLLSALCQAITWTNADIMFVGPWNKLKWNLCQNTKFQYPIMADVHLWLARKYFIITTVVVILNRRLIKLWKTVIFHGKSTELIHICTLCSI